MKFSRTNLLGLSLFVLLFFSGCITIHYDAEQQFNEDGTSVLAIEEYIGLSEELFSSMDSLGGLAGTTSSGGVALQILGGYYASSSYPTFLCSVVEDAEVQECTPKSDGHIQLKVNLEPGEFYTYESSIDWLSLKETKTYRIDKVPMANYYTNKGAGTEGYDEALKEDLKAYLEANIDEYLEEDAYCVADYPFECEFLSYTGNKASVKVSTSSYSPQQIVWMACSDKNSFDFVFMNETEAMDAVTNVVELNQTIADTAPLVVSLTCPSNAKSIAVVYRSESYYDELTTDVDAFEIQTKEDMRQKIIEEFDGMFEGPSGFTTMETTATDYNDYVLNFKRSEFMGSDFQDFGELGGASAALMSIDVSVDYTAKFPNKVVSASIDDEELEVSDNEVAVSMDDFEDLPRGSLVVVTEKELSPLGVFTWIIPLVILVVAAVALLLLFRGKGQPAERVPVTPVEPSPPTPSP